MMEHTLSKPQTVEQLDAKAGCPALPGSVAWAKPSGRVIARFSCGAASAVATKMAIEKYGDAVEIYYTNPGAEHPDNLRFIKECEAWFGQPVNILKSEKYNTTWEVFEARKFLVNHQGAPCTGEMKRIPGDKVWNIGDIEIYGYTANEGGRVAKWQAHNFERILECPLVDKHLTKEDCFGILARVGIALPIMYLLGFKNNNCIGCVKARDNINYWKRTRKYFPEIYGKIAGYERQFGVAINRITRKGVRSEIYLDEIEEGDPTGPDFAVSCGLFCMAEADAFSPQNT
jgi:3'-phosphoadenosine 5'-phosphosulfate sulfotransferase (PAPS reductase)/FAD synthetase